jgi:hypothetical protein
MKKVVSLCLVVLLLLNVLGYYGLFLGLKFNNALQVTHRLNSDNYLESETFTLKVPLTVPYYGDTEFERVDGEIEYNGEFYRLIKQKLQKDTLYIVCFKDLKGKQLHQALAEYVKTFADKPVDNGHGKTIQSFIKDYLLTSFSLNTSSTGWSFSIEYQRAEDTFSSLCFSPHAPPPKV